MNEIIKLILSLSLSGSIVAIVIFAMMPLVKNRFPKSIQYYIWIVVLLRLVLPFSFETSLMNNFFYGEQAFRSASPQSIVLPIADPRESVINSSTMPNGYANVTNGGFNGDVDHSRYFKDLFTQYALHLWLLGVIIALTVNLTGYARFLKYLRLANQPADDEQNRVLAGLLNGRSNVRLARNRFVNTPLLIGILRPCIIIPDINFNENQLKNILLHEVAHLNRFDLGVKWLTMIATSIHWFNPIMYFIKKEINHACELACDEAVIRNLNAAEKQAYGDTLISVVAEHKYPIGVLQATMCEEKKSLKERLIAIMNHNKKSRIIIIFSAILLGFVIFGALYLGAGVGIGKDAPPSLYINAEEMHTYDLAEISKYKTPYVGDSSKVSAIARSLPVPDSYFKQQYISMITDNKPYELNVFYEAKKGALHSSEWPIVNPDNATYANLQKNALVLYCMIDNLDSVTFKFRDSQSDGKLDASKYDTSFTFSRASIEEKYGDLSVLDDNLDLLDDALMGKISAFKGLELYVWKKPGLTGNNDLYYTLLIGTNRNKTTSEVYDLNTAASDLDLIKQELFRYSSGTHLSIFHSMDIDKETMAKIGDALSGAIKNGVISIGGREFDKDLINDLQAPDLRFNK